MCCAVYAVCPNAYPYVETINGVCCFTNAIVAVYQLSRTTFSTSLFMIFTQSCTHALPRSFIFHFEMLLLLFIVACICDFIGFIYAIFFMPVRLRIGPACLPACLYVAL